MTKAVCLLALVGLLILFKSMPSIGTNKLMDSENHYAGDELYRSTSDGDVTLEDEQEDHTIEEEVEKLGHLHGYFKSSDAQHGESDKSIKQQVWALMC